jgi:putative toxin-antitoxin system antitoxin component (TIGR02293 family)
MIMEEIGESYTAYVPENDQDIWSVIQLVRKGIKYLSFSGIMKESHFSFRDWSRFLHLSERTMQRYKKENRYFDPIYSEKIMEISLLYNKGVDVFGKRDNFDKWLETAHAGLGGVMPKDLLDNTFGIQLVNDELTRIEHGIIA